MKKTLEQRVWVFTRPFKVFNKSFSSKVSGYINKDNSLISQSHFASRNTTCTILHIAVYTSYASEHLLLKSNLLFSYFDTSVQVCLSVPCHNFNKFILGWQQCQSSTTIVYGASEVRSKRTENSKFPAATQQWHSGVRQYVGGTSKRTGCRFLSNFRLMFGLLLLGQMLCTLLLFSPKSHFGYRFIAFSVLDTMSMTVFQPQPQSVWISHPRLKLFGPVLKND